MRKFTKNFLKFFEAPIGQVILIITIIAVILMVFYLLDTFIATGAVQYAILFTLLVWQIIPKAMGHVLNPKNTNENVETKNTTEIKIEKKL